MDTPPPEAVDEASLRAALAGALSIGVQDLRYVPKGAGSYHWSVETDDGARWFATVDDLDTKPWIGDDRSTTFAGLTSAYRTAWALHHEDGLDLVVAPRRGGDGSVAVRLSEQHSLAVFPFVDGRVGGWGEVIGPSERARLVGELARLHDARRGRHGGVPLRRRRLPERDSLVAALAALDRPWSGGPFSEPARQVLTAGAGRVGEALARFDDLAQQLDASGADLVVTHGEPHPGNIVHSPQGLRLVDWDTVALAEPERDLWMLDDGTGDAFRTYAEQTGRAVDPVSVECHRLAWTLSDIASFAEMFRSEHPRTGWTELKWNGFAGLVEGTPSPPYGPS